MSIDEIKQIIVKDENRVLELKKTTGELVKGMQSLCAFLNTDGGWLFFGITPDLKILGQNVSDSTQREIANEIRKIEPAISLPMELAEPEYGTDGLFVWITFKRPNNNSAIAVEDNKAGTTVESQTNGQDGQKSDKKSSKKSNKKSSKNNEAYILMLITSNPSITLADLHEATKLSVSGVRKILNRLREQGRIVRVGPDKGGYWKVIPSDSQT